MIRWGRARRLLGLAVYDSWIDVALVQPGSSACQLLQRARFDFPPEASWSHPERLGVALREFLVQHQLTARHAVASLPSHWLLTAAHIAPPVPASESINLLRLAAETEFASARDCVFDCVGRASATESRQVLLTAALQARVDQITTALTAAGLNTLAVSRASLVVSMGELPPPESEDVLLLISQGEAELVFRSCNQVQDVHRLATWASIVQAGVPSADSPLWAALAGEVRRVIAMHPARFSGDRQLHICDGAGMDSRIHDTLCELVVLPAKVVVRVEKAVVPANVPAGLASWALGAETVVAAAVVQGEKLPIDFLHSQLAPSPKRRLTRVQAMLCLAGAAAVLALGLLVLDWCQTRSEVQEMQQQIASMKNDVALAQTDIERTAIARSSFDQRPAYLDCMRALTLAFPTSADVWTTSLALRDDLSGTLSGKSASESAGYELAERLRQSGEFSDVKLLYMRKAERTSGAAFTFALGFTFRGAEAAP